MAENDERQAGATILRDLELFNRAVVFFEQEIIPVALKEVGDVVEGWTESSLWKAGGYREDEFYNIWVAPPQWYADGNDWIAWFSFEYRGGKESNSYQLADLFGVGEADFGFRFQVAHGRFGGKTSWNNFVKTLGGDVGLQLGKRGWVHEGKGVFFRPVKLPVEQLPDAWVNEDWKAALEPLERALGALVEDISIFDDIVTQATPSDS